MKRRIIELIPEFELIEDEDLRERTLRVWLKALDEGGWKPDDLDRIPFTLLIPDCSVSFLQHVRGVVGVVAASSDVLMSLYGEKLALNRDYLLAGALLHDVGKLVEYSEQEDGSFVKSSNGAYLRHPFSGVGLCYGEGIPPEVIHIVAVHSKEGDSGKRTPEAWVLHYADFMNFETLR